MRACKIVYSGNIKKALDIINAKYEGNIKFETLKTLRTRRDGTRDFKVRLSTLSYDKAGWRYAGTGRKTRFASWHVHGEFFEALFALEPAAVVYSAGRKITKQGGNWQDWNAGSMMYPRYMSECSVR